ncbi:MAG TPA: hypothetical protein VJN90_11070 [Candidatus Acidoferrales bacterium]|nr:hypothetical protein [Candidatus Acidoferrales bacterium]
MRTITTEQFDNALAFLKNRHKVELSQTASSGHAMSENQASLEHEPGVTVDGQSVQREDVVRMAETEDWSDGWKPSGSSTR